MDSARRTGSPGESPARRLGVKDQQLDVHHLITARRVVGHEIAAVAAGRAAAQLFRDPAVPLDAALRAMRIARPAAPDPRQLHARMCRDRLGGREREAVGRILFERRDPAAHVARDRIRGVRACRTPVVASRAARPGHLRVDLGSEPAAKRRGVGAAPGRRVLEQPRRLDPDRNREREVEHALVVGAVVGGESAESRGVDEIEDVDSCLLRERRFVREMRPEDLRIGGGSSFDQVIGIRRRSERPALLRPCRPRGIERARDAAPAPRLTRLHEQAVPVLLLGRAARVCRGSDHRELGRGRECPR